MKLYYFYNDTFQVFPRYESIYFDSLLFENDGRVSIKMSQIERLRMMGLSLSSTGVSIRHRLQLSSDLSYRSLYSTTISLTEQKAKEFVSFYHFLDTQVSLALASLLHYSIYVCFFLVFFFYLTNKENGADCNKIWNILTFAVFSRRLARLQM